MIVNINPVLLKIKENIEELNIFKSVKLGLERGADSAINLPLCRLVVEEIANEGVLTDLILQIVIAFNTKNDYEKLYLEFFEVDYKIKNNLFKLPYKIKILNSITDEDRLSSLKAGIIRIKIEELYEN